MNLRNFRSSRRMTRRSSTCRSALLMVLPDRRNNLYISILPGVFSVASVHQRLWMARRALLMAGASAGAGLGAGAGSGAGVGSGAGLGRSGLSGRRSGLGRLGRSGLTFDGRLRAQAHRRERAQSWHPCRACARRPLRFSRGEFPPEPIPGPLHLLKGGASRQCVSRAHGGEQALVRSQSARRGRHRRREGKRGNDGSKSGCRRQKKLYTYPRVHTGCGQVLMTVFETSI